MYKRRTKSPAAMTVVVLIAVLGMATGALAQKGDVKTPPPKSGTGPSTTSSPPAAADANSDQTVFRPKETIAPGKPVSFPSDI